MLDSSEFRNHGAHQIKLRKLNCMEEKKSIMAVRGMEKSVHRDHRFVLFDLIFYVPVNNFSVLLGRFFSG